MPERPPPAASKDKKPLWLRVLIWIGIAYAAVMGLSLVVFIAGENRGFSSLLTFAAIGGGIWFVVRRIRCSARRKPKRC